MKPCTFTVVLIVFCLVFLSSIHSAQAITASDIPLRQITSSTPASNQSADTWQWFKFVVPSATDPANPSYEPNFLGWDLRLKVTSGSARMVIRRDQVPIDFSTHASSYDYLDRRNNWPTGYQWAPGIGDRPRWYGESGPTRHYSGDKDSYLIVGLGSPLEAGTYYVGVSGDGNDTVPLSYTLESRAIGIGNNASGKPWSIQVMDLHFAGGSANGTGLAPREAVYYRVTVPAGAKSWALKLEPTLGDALMTIRHAALPNMTADASYRADDANYGYTSSFAGTRRQKDGREFFYKHPESPQQAITPGIYYIAVFSEGQNPADTNTIGTGGVNYTLVSSEELPIADKTSTPMTMVNPVTWSSQTLAYGEQKIYRCRVPAGISSLEVIQKNRAGNPVMTLRRDENGNGQIPANGSASPYTTISSYRPAEGGNSVLGSSDRQIIITEPSAGDYTLVVFADSMGGSTPDASFDLEVRALIPVQLELDKGSVTRTLEDQEIHFYQVTVPSTVNGFPVAGWKIGSRVTNGATKLYVGKNVNPTVSDGQSIETSMPFIVLSTPFLAPGTWQVAVKGAGTTNYTLTSEIISADPLKHRRSWSMPSKSATFSQAGLEAPWFGDSGIDGYGNPIINPNTGDQNTSIGYGDWHFYRITVPDENGGILKTMVEALGGNLILYLRKDGVPSPFHNRGTITSTEYPWDAYDRSQIVIGTKYGNWVPLGGRTEMQLVPGGWWLGIRAVDSDSRYRLKVAAGNVRGPNGPMDGGFFQDLDLTSGNKSSQMLVAGDMRYYRVTIPQSSTTQGNSSPTNWQLSIQSNSGEIKAVLRDTVPPGLGIKGAIDSYNYLYDLIDWSDDRSGYDYYLPFGTNGTTEITTPPLRPGATYYVGVYAMTDATFDISSSVGEGKLKLDGIIPFASGSLSTTLAAGEQRLYRIDIPSNALVWRHRSQHDAGVQLHLSQGTVPSSNRTHWVSGGTTGSSMTQPLGKFPWQAGYSYYLRVENTTNATQSFAFDMDGRNTPSPLTVSVFGNCPGSTVEVSSPENGFSRVMICASGTCTADVVPYTSLLLKAVPGPGCSNGAWTGMCSEALPGECRIVIDQPVVTSVTFNDVMPPSVTLVAPATSTTSTIPITINATDNVGVIGYCLMDMTVVDETIVAISDSICSSTPPNSYTFNGLPFNTPTVRYLAVGATDPEGNVGPTWEVVSITLTEAPLTVTMEGTGSGSVNSNPPGLACTEGSCSRNYALNSSINLLATPSAGSTFTGWSGACSGTASCSITMNSAKSVTASFNQLPNVRLNRVSPLYFSTLQGGYDSAVTGDVIQLKEGSLDGPFKASRAIDVTLKGGQNSTFDASSSYTILKGTVTIGSGTVTLQDIVIK